MNNKTHLALMHSAMRLALRAKGQTSPNPLVGALVVKGKKIIAEGYHRKAGLAHAEVIALDKAGGKAKGALLYVTLEPCAHFGRTPPCVDRIIQSGIKKVIVGMLDPNPLNNGRGIALLRKNGIKVEVGFLEEKLKKINESFIKYITKRSPWVTVKVGQSLDGKIATRSGDSQWITSDRSREYAHRIRGEYDAIMVGVNTILRDNPKLNNLFAKKSPIVVVVDSQLSVSPAAQVFKNLEVIIVTLPSAVGQETENRLILNKQAKILEVKEKEGQVNLRDMMKKLAAQQITSILVEGGGTLIGSLFDEGLVDKVIFFVSPKIIGGREAISSVMGKGILRIDKAIRLKEVKLKRIGEDFLVKGYVG